MRNLSGHLERRRNIYNLDALFFKFGESACNYLFCKIYKPASILENHTAANFTDEVSSLINNCSAGMAGKLLHNSVFFTRVNPLRPTYNGRHFADDIFKHIFINENVWIPINISLKCVSKGPIEIFHNRFWSATSHYLNQWWKVHWRICTSLGPNDLP